MKPTFDPVQGRTVTFHFDYDTSKLKAGSSGAPATTHVKATIGSFPIDTVFGDTPEDLTSIGVPSWLKVAPTNQRYNATSGEYELIDAALAKLSWNAATTTTRQWLANAFNGLPTYAYLQPIIDVRAPLDINSPIDWKSKGRIEAKAAILGHTVWNKTGTNAYQFNDLDFSGQVDSRTLKFDTLSVALKAPVQLANMVLFDKTFSLAPTKDKVPEFLFKSSIDLAIKATAGLEANGGVKLKWDNTSNTVVLVAAGATGTDGTFLDLTATGGLYASLSGTVKILMGLGDASLTGGINASLGLWGRMTFAGPWNKPHIASTSLSLELTGYYYYAILVNGSPKFDSRTDSQGTTDEEFKLTVF